MLKWIFNEVTRTYQLVIESERTTVLYEVSHSTTRTKQFPALARKITQEIEATLGDRFTSIPSIWSIFL